MMLAPVIRWKFWLDVSNEDHYTYEWNFGDGTSALGQDPSHIYANTGNYNVSVTLTNAFGADTTLTTIAEIGGNVGFNYAEMELPGSLCPGDEAQFWAYTSNGKTFQLDWNFDDGNISDKPYPLPSYSAPVSVIIINGRGNDTTLTSVIEVRNDNPLTAGNIDFDYLGENGYCPGDPVTFVHFMQGMDVSIDFGDGSNPVSEFTMLEIGEGYIYPITTHAYSYAGVFTVSLTATNGCGYSATASYDIEIGNSLQAALDPGWEPANGGSSIVT